MHGTIGDIGHVIRCLNRQRMMGKARSRRDIGRHFACDDELAIRPLRQHCDHQIFQRDHADAKLHQLSIGQLRNVMKRLKGGAALAPPSLSHLDRAIWRCSAGSGTCFSSGNANPLECSCVVCNRREPLALPTGFQSGEDPSGPQRAVQYLQVSERHYTLYPREAIESVAMLPASPTQAKQCTRPARLQS